jgi:carbon starvation protein
MNSMVLILITFFGYIASYYLYGKYLSKKIFKLNDSCITPAYRNQDGHDYVPSKKELVFGHHFHLLLKKNTHPL